MRTRVPAIGVLLLVLVGCQLPTDSRAPTMSENVAKANGVLLEVKFQEALQVRLDAQGRPHSVRGVNLGTVHAALARLKVGPVRPLITLPVATLDAMSQDATRRSGRHAPDLASWYHLVLPAGADTTAALAELRSLAEVSDAYVAPVAVRPPVTPDFTPNQNNYFGAAPSGTENVYARSLPGGTGAGVRLIDIEYDWNFSHEDLGLPSSTLIAGFPRATFGNDHGTAVLGVLVGRNNGFGVLGGAPGAAIRVVSPYINGISYNPADAVTAASNYGDPGDVILLEQQADGPASGNSDFVPIEWITSVFDAIQVATLAGRIVVEAAGNGNQNLDAAIFNGRFNRLGTDSRAIIVGAGDGANARLSFSTYGSRLDVQAHGTSVTTTGYGGLFGTSPSNFYTSGFNGTSSASAVVAAAATSLQGYQRARGRPLLTAPEMASLFRGTGSPQTGSTAQRIGSKPNLRAAIARLDAPIATPGLATRCTGVPGRDGSPRVIVDVTQNAPGTALTVERLAGTTWSVIKVLPAGASGVYTYSTGFTSGDFRARSTLAGSSSAPSAAVHKNC